MIAKSICRRCKKEFEYDVCIANGWYCSKECKRKPKKEPAFRYENATSDEKLERMRQEFERRVIKNENGCWSWSGGKYPNGYVKMGCMGRPMGHRASWILHFGPIPNDKLVCHHCDNRECCRPDHLFLGTYSDNNRDMHTKRRGMIGDDHTNSKLCVNQVREIRKLLKKGISHSTIAKQFNVGRGSITAINLGKTWRHVQIED